MFKHLIQMLHYPKTGKNQQISIFPWISTDFNNFANPELLQTPGQPTSVWFDDFGNSFIVKRAGTGGWSQGDDLTWSGVGAQAATAPFFADTVASATARVVTTTAVAYTVGAEVNHWLYDNTLPTTVNDRLKLIKANTASTLTVSNVDTRISNLQNDPDAYTTIPSAADAITTIRPEILVTFPTANIATAMPMGIAVQAVTVGNWGFAQIDGLAMVNASGNVTAIVAGAPVVPDGVTAGAVKGAAAVAANQVGTATAAKATLTTLMPIWLQILAAA